MASVGFIYSTVDGHTRKICERLVEIVEKSGHSATLIELMPDSAPNLQPFDQVVIGASIRYGKHRPEVAEFVARNQDALDARKGAFFSVNAVARKADKKTPETNPYVRKFLDRVAWRPAAIGIFGGRIHYASYGFLDRTMIRFIMWMTKGPTSLDSDVDFTDWDDVMSFGQAICDLADSE